VRSRKSRAKAFLRRQSCHSRPVQVALRPLPRYRLPLNPLNRKRQNTWDLWPLRWQHWVSRSHAPVALLECWHVSRNRTFLQLEKQFLVQHARKKIGQPPSVQVVNSNDPDGDDEMDSDVESTSSRRLRTIEMLHSEPLFQVDVMKAELVVTHSRAKLLPAKFTDRVPQLPPEFRPKSHSLPPTDGITILERLIQLGESCHWFTQKLEHVWGFHRALDESFSLTLLQVEHLFDIDNLVGLFQKSDRNKGAGFCSRSAVFVRFGLNLSHDRLKEFNFGPGHPFWVILRDEGSTGAKFQLNALMPWWWTKRNVLFNWVYSVCRHYGRLSCYSLS